ncbi:MAG TPA: DUF4332 domain-containing protein, partial [Candidatus Thermoplasmatota archaeon]|nr:DUF4332 domain-containing protein [Candidatus Thermoplasmatota archaeon]
MPAADFETTCPNCHASFDVRADAREATCPACKARVALVDDAPAAPSLFARSGRVEPPRAGRPAKAPQPKPTRSPKPKAAKATPARFAFLRRDRTPGPDAPLPAIELEGIGEVAAQTLARAGVRSTDDLVAADLKPLAKRTGLKPGDLRKWQDMAELVRLPKVGPQYAEALVRADVNSIRELALQEPAGLARRIGKVQGGLATRILGVGIRERRVQGWVEEARKLAPGPARAGEKALRKAQRMPLESVADEAPP